MRHNPDHVAHVAAVILSGHREASKEPHVIAAAVTSAIALLDEAHARDRAHDPEPPADTDKPEETPAP